MSKITILLPVALLLLVPVFGCESLKVSKPIIPIQEYEELLVGRLDANYVGNDTCLSACHYHDEIRRAFEASTMGAQLSADSGMPLVDCESCHGPGSLAISGITPEQVEADAKAGKQTACNFETFIPLKTIPPPAQSLLCLKCHTANATFNLHNWISGAHAQEGVSCFSCHNIHAGPDLITNPLDTKEMCLQCHKQQASEFLLPSHHPVMEKKLFCTDCHQPHGTMNDHLLPEPTVRETCIRCHGQYAGPFVYEHADVSDECTSCHNSHGSINNNLLVLREPFLCLQCHGGHDNPDNTEAKQVFYSRCTDCHSQIHGTDLPSPSGKGMFTH